MEDRRIAVAAVVVSGVVGLGSAFFSWRTTVESSKAVGRSERVRDDLAELRGVVDSAATLRQEAGAKSLAVLFAAQDWEALRRPTRAEAAKAVVSVRRRYHEFQQVYQRGLVTTVRLRVRLGIREPLARDFQSSLDRFDGAVNDVMAYVEPHERVQPRASTADAAWKRGLDAGQDGETAFNERAAELVGSEYR